MEIPKQIELHNNINSVPSYKQNKAITTKCFSTSFNNICRALHTLLPMVDALDWSKHFSENVLMMLTVFCDVQPHWKWKKKNKS
jgi:hypothetical protein